MKRRLARVLSGTIATIFVLSLAWAMFTPLSVYADDLSATIRQEISKDPRTAHMTPQQIDDMVALLAKQAQAQGVTTHDIVWRPATAAPVQQAVAPVSCQGISCDWLSSLGVDSISMQDIVMLAAASLILLSIAVFLRKRPTAA